MSHLKNSLLPLGDIAVAVSGGGDSMALLLLLHRWVAAQGKNKITLHALTVDHGLRPESKAEAGQVATWVKKMPGVRHKILTWRGAKPKTKIAETARAKRYQLLQAYCTKNKIKHLFLAHTLDDQAETFLLRLSAGSGVDGLSAMRPVEILSPHCHSRASGNPERQKQNLDPCFREDDRFYLIRPLLNIPHERLLAFLRAAGQGWIEDPTNKNTAYARPRLRAARNILAREGLTPERLGITAGRMNRARGVCEQAAITAWKGVEHSATECRVARALWQTWLPDTQIRVLMHMVKHVGRKPPRLEQIEALFTALGEDLNPTLRRTLAGCILTRGARWIKVTRE